MKWVFTELAKLFQENEVSKLLSEGNFGIEKESQRVSTEGELALTPHPEAFGDKTTNMRITTDFSESQIEMITSPFDSVDKTFSDLNSINTEVEKGIGGELLWPFSMPPRLPNEDDIPIASFSNSETDREMETYRKGLALRYGKKMQMISGLHYNFSFGEGLINLLYEQFGNKKDIRSFIDEVYFGLTRNFLRYRWLLIYLFGASPYCDSTYYPVIKKEIRTIKKCCPNCLDLFENFNEYATSLRVSRFGYSNTFKREHNIYFDSLKEYATKLRELMATKSVKYSKLGIYKNGSKIQLNENILQKESEFYSSIRLKQTPQNGETQLDALEKRGVKYIEIRILDLNPYEKLGISIEQMQFLQVFMIYCLFEESSFINEDEYAEINSNHHLVALFGRKENLILHRHNRGLVALKEWGEEIFQKLRIVAELMDNGTGDNKYYKSVESEHKKLFDISLIPSEKIHREMRENNENYLEFGIRRAIKNLQKNIIGVV